MSEVNKPIPYKKDLSPYEKILIHPIEKDKKHKEEAKSPQEHFQLFSALLLFFEKILSLFNPDRQNASSATVQTILKDALAFRKLLVTLAGEDLSHHPDFNQQLVRVWHTLLDDCNSSPSKTPPSLSIFSKVNFFILQIKNFPIGAEHSLGYYFSHHAGDHWIPFPFMDLLQQLHQEFLSSPSTSTLRHWIVLLDEILLSSGKK
jgi:hypothetical protein